MTQGVSYILVSKGRNFSLKRVCDLILEVPYFGGFVNLAEFEDLGFFEILGLRDLGIWGIR